MSQLLIFIYLCGIVSFIEALFDKFYVWDLLNKKASESKSLFLYNLTSCRFCIRFHLTWLIYMLFIVFDLVLQDQVFAIFAVSGLLTLINKNR